jgi:MFS transporter, DHA2 family, multidrug resistance protein
MDTAPQPERSAQADGLPTPARYLAAATVGVAVVMAVLDATIVNVALPVVAKDYAIAPARAIWIVNAYQLAIICSLLPLASLGEIVGYRRVYAVGLTLFTLASLACALAGSLEALVAARIVQGLGAAGIMSVNSALVRFIYPSSMLGRGLGYNALIVGVASAAGPSIAAAILSVASWSWLFLINVPFGCLALAGAFRALPETPRSGARFDLVSAGLSALTFGLLITGIDGLAEPGAGLRQAAHLALAVAVGAAFVLYQLRLPRPLLPVDLLRIPVFALSMAASVCSFAAQAIGTIALPFYLHDTLGKSEAATGLLMTPWPLMTATLAAVSGWLADRFPPAALGGIGLVLFCAGLASLALLPTQPSDLDIAWRLALCGTGFGFFQSPNNRIIVMSAPRHRAGGASGMLATARLTGQSTGVAMVAVIFGLVATQRTEAALWLAAALALGGALASSLRLRHR